MVEGGPARLDHARRALAGIAELPDETTAWIFEAALRQRPEVAQDAAWQQNLGAMIEKAQPHGWIDEQSKAIKAHIEWAHRHESGIRHFRSPRPQRPAARATTTSSG